MTAKDILIQWLKDNGYDGLCGYTCGCGLSDLCPCDCMGTCVPAYVIKCTAAQRRAHKCPDAMRCYGPTKQSTCPEEEDDNASLLGDKKEMPNPVKGLKLSLYPIIKEH